MRAAWRQRSNRIKTGKQYRSCQISKSAHFKLQKLARTRHSKIGTTLESLITDATNSGGISKGDPTIQSALVTEEIYQASNELVNPEVKGEQSDLAAEETVSTPPVAPSPTNQILSDLEALVQNIDSKPNAQLGNDGSL